MVNCTSIIHLQKFLRFPFFALILGADPPSYRSLFEVATTTNSRSPIYQEAPPSFWERQGCLCEKNKCECFLTVYASHIFFFKTVTLKTYIATKLSLTFVLQV